MLNVLCVWVLVRYASPNTAGLAHRADRDRAQSADLGLRGRRSRSIRSPPAIPQPVDAFIDALGRSSLALGLLIVGAGLRIEELTRLKPLTLPTCALKLVVMPAIAIAIALGLRTVGRQPVGDRLLHGGAGRLEFLRAGAPARRRRAADGANHHDRDRSLAVVTMPVAIALVT